MIRLLLIEDDEDDYFIAKDVFEEIPDATIEVDWVEDYETAFRKLRAGAVDICFVDYRIGGATGLDFIERVRAAGILTPLVLLTGVGQHDIDVAATEVGASDFIDKSELSARLVERTIRYAIANAETLQALAEKRSLLETTLECASAGIAAFEANGDCAARNSRFDQMLNGILPGATERSTHAEVCGVIAAKIEHAVEEGRPAAAEFTDSTGIVYEVSRTPTPLGGYVYLSVDVTQRKAAQAAMLAAKRDAEAASRAKSSFFANVSHELRTPLHAIIGFSDLLIADPDSAERAEFAQMINDGGKNLLEIINTVILFSRIESGQHNFTFEEVFDLEHFIKDSVRALDTHIVERNARIEIQIEPGFESLRADQMALRTILSNLVGNAIDFSPEGGTITIALSHDSDGLPVLRVSDEGVGIAPDKVERVFDPFYQADDSLDRSHEGVGLGLPLVRMLGEAHGARTELVSDPGLGTTVTLTFPAAAGSVAAIDDSLPLALCK